MAQWALRVAAGWGSWRGRASAGGYGLDPVGDCEVPNVPMMESSGRLMNRLAGCLMLAGSAAEGELVYWAGEGPLRQSCRAGLAN
jgi:hypothetical protein